MDDDENAVFEIEDYTTQGDLEKFISQIEDQLNNWKLNTFQRHAKLDRFQLSQCEWSTLSHELNLTEHDSVRLEYHAANLGEEAEFTLAEESLEASADQHIAGALLDLESNANDFAPRGHPIVNWYSLRQFMVLSTKLPIKDEGLMALLISATQSALFNCHCEVPIFIECGDKYRQMYNGRLLAAGSMTELQVAHFSRGYERRHHEVSNLTALLTIFKSKCRTPLDGPALLSIRLSYTIPTVMPKHAQSPLGHYCSLPWGARAPPIEAIKVAATWPVVTEDLVDDALEYTDLDATQAPQWSVQLKFNHTTKTGLARTIHKLLKIWNMDRTQEYYLDQIPSFVDEATMGGAFDQLTQSDAQKHFSVLTHTLSINTDNVPVTGAFAQIKDEIDATIESIFQPDEYTVGSSATEVEDELDGMKSTPKGSILRKLAISLLHQLGQSEHVELRFAYLWARFVRHLRKRHIDQGQLITSVTAPQPQLQFCLAQQKLEMVSYCIRASRARDDRVFAEKSLPGLVVQTAQNDSDEEFFDCDSAETLEYEVDNTGVDKATSMCLLKHPERKINIPKLQSNPPTTEDMLMRREREMTQLGSGEEGRKARVKMQSRLLEMDMSAFKAANCGATFEDFVRWHSPTDWSHTEGLSQRMTLPGNVWVELWAECLAQPAEKQPRLFDDTAELEQIMGEWGTDGMTLGRIVELLLPILIHEGLRATIRNITGNEKIDNSDLLRMVPTKVAIESSQMNTMSYQSIEQLAEIIEQIETFDSRRKWLRTRFVERGETAEIVAAFNASVLSKPETQLEGASRGPIGRLLTDEVELRFPAEEKRPYALYGLTPSSREYIMRTKVARPTSYSTVLPQRLYAYVDDEQFRLAGAFSSDTTFII